MNSKNFLLIGIFFCTNILFAQQKELEFNVAKTNVQLTPTYEYLIHEAPHKISVVSKNKNIKIKLVLAGGSVLIRDKDTVLIAENLNGNGVLLKVYETSAGEDNLLFTKNYEVIGQPVLYIEDTPIEKVLIDILDTNSFSYTLNVKAKYKETLISFEVTSYNLGMSCTCFNLQKFKGNELNAKKLKRLSKCFKPNTNMYIERVLFEFLPGEFYKAKPGTLKFNK